MENTNDYVAGSIRRLRTGAGLSQDEFAAKIGVARPTISNWENGKIVPTTEQLIKLSRTFNVTIDSIVGITVPYQNWVVPDTSALLNRPRLITDLYGKFDRIIIPEVVVSELNYQKDRRKNNSAWLVMSEITNLRKEQGSRIEYRGCRNPGRINDDTIIQTAVEASLSIQGVAVYVLSNDIYFQMRRDIPNVTFLNMEEYDRRFGGADSGCSIEDTADFTAAVRTRKLDQARRIFAKGRVDPNHVDQSDGMTPLIHAVRNRDRCMIKFLLDIPGVDIDRRDEKKYALAPVAHAVQVKDAGTVRLLIEHGCDVNALSQGKNCGNTALMIACWHGLEDIVGVLLEAGACVNQQDSNGFTPLMKCCIQGHAGCARRILATGKADTDIRSRRDGFLTARDYALKFGHQDVAALVRGEPAD